MREKVVELKGLTKLFGRVYANNKVNLDLYEGEILSLLGENGSGKTTLMNMLAGIYYPDAGHIYVNGKEAEIRSPHDAFKLGIGMIHQHYKLVDIFTAVENIVLGLPGSAKLDIKAATKDIASLIEKYGFEVNLEKKVYEMSVSEKQTVEIVKMLYRGANILILDEPTAVLTPQETERLFEVLRNMRADGKSIIIITHKLAEVLEISDRVSVLRKGLFIGTVDTKDADEQDLTDMMVGKRVNLNIERKEPHDVKPMLFIDNLSCSNEEGVKALDSVSFTVSGGEILGIAGIAGSGQKELLEAIAGLHKADSGSIRYLTDNGEVVQLVGKTSKDIKAMGIALAFVPEDRLGMGLVGSMGMAENMMLRSYADSKGFFLERKAPNELAEEVKERLEVVTPGINFPVRRLSGGNVQKVLVGREIAQKPRVLMTAYAVRGLDIHTSHTIYSLLGEEKEKGTAVVYVGEDLDVLLELCDKILVLCGGKVSGIVDARKVTKDEIGLLMTKYEAQVSKPENNEEREEEAKND